MSDRTVAGGILCAGFGSRLRPLTETVPKPLLPFLNTPIVTYALNHLARLGVERVGVNLHHLADTIPPVLDRLAATFDLEPTYAREWEILGTAGGIRGIWKALDEFDGTLVVLNGDSIMNIDLEAHLAEHRASGRDASIVVRPKADDQPGRVWLDDDGELHGIRDHRRPGAPSDLTEYDFTGVHLIETQLLERVPMEEGDIIEVLYGPMLEADEALGVTVNDDFWAALDNPKLFLDTTRRVLEDPSIFEQCPTPGDGEGLYFFGAAGIDDDAQFAAPVFVGMNAEVEGGARIGPNAVIDGVHVASGAEIDNAILYGMGDVEGEWRDCIAVAGEVVTLQTT